GGAVRRGEPAPLAPAVQGLRGLAAGVLPRGALARQEEYWLRQLSGPPSLELPTDFPRPVRPSFRGGNAGILFNPAMTVRLKALARSEGTRVYMVLASALCLLLSRLSGAEEILLGSPIANRPHADLEGMVGMFVNTVVLRMRPSGRLSFREYLQGVK